MRSNSTVVTHKYGRKFHTKPTPEKLFVFNRPFRYINTSIFTHCEDIYEILTQKLDKCPSVLGLVSDNGPDFSPNNISVVFAYGKQKIYLRSTLAKIKIRSADSTIVCAI